MSDEKKVHGNTRKAADKDLAAGTITEQSHAAVLAGQMDLATARNIGADDGPTDTPEGRSGPLTATGIPGRASAEDTDAPQDTPKSCLCGCGEPVRGKKSRFRPGHDARLHGELKRNLEKDPLLRNERFTEKQREYAKERGLI